MDASLPPDPNLRQGVMDKTDKILFISAPVFVASLLTYHILVDQYIVVLAGSWMFWIFTHIPVSIYTTWLLVRKSEHPIVWWKSAVKAPFFLLWAWLVLILPGRLAGSMADTFWIKSTAETTLHMIRVSEPYAYKGATSFTYEFEDDLGQTYHASIPKGIQSTHFDPDLNGKSMVYQIKTGLLGRSFIDIRDPIQVPSAP
ncbi:MAG: hypothetical protein IPK50_16425 [Fibrobacterota bacterium]|nr:hypothetical protein [Fibrobacterota bacterium]QQS03867.1 MAG: hypothetical protein IPK50_16425 [Fibrobacterota bacterium]